MFKTIRTLSKAISLMESTRPEDFKTASDLLEQLPKPENTLRLGVSGPPGAGKSTLIDSLGISFLEKGHKVGVLTVDPSSPVAGGAILADKTRMERLSRSENVFIRPSPSGAGYLGGLNFATADVIRVMEAAGYDIIIVESIGVGQNEVATALTTDLTLFVLSPAAGDDLQGIKKGVLELADCLVVNKCDGDLKILAKKMAADYRSSSSCDVLLCSAQTDEGVSELADHLLKLYHSRKTAGDITKKRHQQHKQQLKSCTLHLIQQHFEEKLSAQLPANSESVPLRKQALELFHKLIS